MALTQFNLHYLRIALAPFLKTIRAGTRADILGLCSRSLFLYIIY